MFAKTATKALIASAAALVATTAVSASPNDRVITKTVSYADLDMASDAGREALDDRINVAAREVCWTAVTEKIVTAQQWGECRVQSFNEARKAAVTVLAARADGTSLASSDNMTLSVGSR